MSSYFPQLMGRKKDNTTNQESLYPNNQNHPTNQPQKQTHTTHQTQQQTPQSTYQGNQPLGSNYNVNFSTPNKSSAVTQGTKRTSDYDAQSSRSFHEPKLQQQKTMQRSEVILKQDQQTVNNILGRVLAAIERYIICVVPNVQLDRKARYYDETQRDPRFDNPQVLLGDIDLQITLASKSVALFVKDHQQRARDILAALDKDLWEQWAPCTRGKNREVDLYIAYIWRLLKTEPISLPPIVPYAPPAPIETVITNVMDYAKSRCVIEEQRKEIENNPEAEVRIQLGSNVEPALHMEKYNEQLHGEDEDMT